MHKCDDDDNLSLLQPGVSNAVVLESKHEHMKSREAIFAVLKEIGAGIILDANVAKKWIKCDWKVFSL